MASPKNPALHEAKVELVLIAAVGKQGQLGLGNALPWHDPADLRWFKQTTMGHRLIVGWRTAQSLPPLPGRTIIVDDTKRAPEAFLADLEPGVIYVAGGAKTYARYLPLTRRSIITHVDYSGNADVFMPPLWGYPESRKTP